MNKITQTMRFRQAVIEYSNKHGVTAAAIRYHLNRQYIYRCGTGTTVRSSHWQTDPTVLTAIPISIQRKRSS